MKKIKNIYIITCVLLLVPFSLFSQVSSGYIGMGPWYEVGSIPAKAALQNTTNTYLNAKAIVGGTAPIDNANLSVHGNMNGDGTFTVLQPSTNTTTGLQLPQGATPGSVLTSDAQGKTKWQEGEVHYQTMVAGIGGDTKFTFATNMKIDFFKDIFFDTAKEIFGSSYGWDISNQQYVVPKTGVYRIAMNIYFRPTVLNQNSRVYIYKNNIVFSTPGIVSITESTSDQSKYVMGLCSLNKDDIISFRTSIGGAGSIPGSTILFGAIGHTYILIESL